MEIRIYVSNDFRNENSPLNRPDDKGRLLDNNFVSGSQTTLTKLYKEGWKINSVTYGDRSGTFPDAKRMTMFMMEKPV